jgi:arsenic resistance protein ArsH
MTILLRPHVARLTDRYSERKERGRPPVDPALDLATIAVARQR